MDLILQLIAALAVLLGTGFSVLGVLGYVRFPDVFTRLHATGKVSVFGVVLFSVAAMFWTPNSLGKEIALVFLLALGGPVVSHAIGSTAYRMGIKPHGLVRDDLAPLVTPAPPEKNG